MSIFSRRIAYGTVQVLAVCAITKIPATSDAAEDCSGSKSIIPL